MKRLKKWIIVLIILIIIVITILGLLFMKKQSVGTDYNYTDFEQDDSHMQLNTEIEKVKNRNNFYMVKNVIGKYSYAIIDEGKESVYQMLNPDYLTENNITKENVLMNTEKINKEDLTEEQIDNLTITVDIDDMYYKDLKSNMAVYFVYGQFKYNVNSIEMPFSIIVEIDSGNNAFYIYPTKYVEKNYPEFQSLSNYSSDIEEIKKNSYNEFTFYNIEDITIINDYLSKYKNEIIYDIDQSYERIDESYKEVKFSTREQYEAFIKENIKDLLSISIAKYKVDQKEDYTQYTCVDQKGNYYIIRETAIMEYTLMLDTYTVDIPEFIEKYQVADGQTKVGMNVEKIIQALNKKDYEYIYSKLDEIFRKNNFATLEEFSQYMQNHYPSTYDVEYSNASEENGIYIQPIVLTSKSGENQIENNIIVQLNENTDFIISFNVE